MMAEQDLGWFLKNDEAFATLSESQVSELTKGGTVEYGDTGEPGSDGTPAAAAEETTTEAKPEPKVIARDGEHEIPYEEHRKAISRAQAAEDRAAELEAVSKTQAD